MKEKVKVTFHDPETFQEHTQEYDPYQHEVMIKINAFLKMAYPEANVTAIVPVKGEYFLSMGVMFGQSGEKRTKVRIRVEELESSKAKKND